MHCSNCSIDVSAIILLTKAVMQLNLYRYMSKQKFLDIIETGNLTFVAPLVRWIDNDKNEGPLYHYMQNPAKRKEIEEILIKNHLSVPSFVVGNTVLNNLIKCQCWSKYKNSRYLWNAYANECESVMIASSRRKLESLNFKVKASTGDSYSTYVKSIDIEYIDLGQLSTSSALETEVLHVFRNNSASMIDVYRIKDSSYSFEGEVRIYVGGAVDPNNPGTYDQDIHISITDTSLVSDFIDEVWVHPDATEDFFAKIQGCCIKNGLTFMGRPTL